MGCRRTIAIRLAPPAPPCFPSRTIWLSYVGSAAEDPHLTHPPVRPGARAFNPRFSYCADCSPEYRAEQEQMRQCRPDYLRDLLAERATAT